MVLLQSSIREHGAKITDDTMKPYSDFKLYNLIKEQIPEKLRHRSLVRARPKVRLMEDQCSAISIETKGKAKFD